MFELFCVLGFSFYLKILFLLFCFITAILTVFNVENLFPVKKPIMGVYSGDK
jgi:hypothetical protein